MSVRRITTTVALLGAGLASQVSAAGTTPTKDPVVVKAVVPTPAATAPAVAAAPTGPVGKVEIKETIFDAGSVDRGTDLSHSFSLKNVGPGDLTVDAKPG